MKTMKFDMYTITNISFMDIAQKMGIQPQLWGVHMEDF